MRSDDILRILDDCAVACTFPALDNGYVYLAATRLSLYRSAEDWALVIEVFGFSPREGTPSTSVQTFASRLRDRNRPENYVTAKAYENYLANNPHNEFRSVYPLGEIIWEDEERVAEGVREVSLRGRPVDLPELGAYERFGIDLTDPERVSVFEACRYLAAIARNDVLATQGERRISVRPEMDELMLFEEWDHPDIVGDERPSGSHTFQQIARVLETGNPRLYAPTDPSNTHWRHWPDGGSL
jgi:hypothetical protein